MSDLLYPTVEQLRKIEKWPIDNFRSLLEFLSESWFKDYGRAWQDGSVWCFATGGWSGNEELIDAFAANIICWTMLWKSSSRGGLHTFILPEDARRSRMAQPLIFTGEEIDVVEDALRNDIGDADESGALTTKVVEALKHFQKVNP